MILERCLVSRKTPRDGKLEISSETADRLRRRLDAVPPTRLQLGDAAGEWTLTTMQCSCGGSGMGHLHHFLQSELLKSLEPERRVSIALEDGGGTVRVVT